MTRSWKGKTQEQQASGFSLGQVRVVCRNLMTFLTRITVHIFYRIMGLAMHICKVLSSVQVDPKSFRRTTSIHVHNTNKVYRVSAHAAQRGNRGALVDRGANGGIIGNDAHVFTHTQDKKSMLLGSITSRSILSQGCRRKCKDIYTTWRSHRNILTVRLPREGENHPLIWTNRVVHRQCRPRPIPQSQRRSTRPYT